MINTEEKIYRENNKFCLKIVTNNNEIKFVPNNEANTDYQAIQEWIADGGQVIDNGGGEWVI